MIAEVNETLGLRDVINVGSCSKCMDVHSTGG